MNDGLRERLARIDPMSADVPVEPVTSEASRRILEKVMSTELKERAAARRPQRSPWTLPVAALAALVVAVGGVIGLGFGSEDAPTTAALELSAPAEDMFASCIMFSPEELARSAELAFEGTVTSVEGSKVALKVDTWFKGGDYTDVVLDAPQGMEALIGGIPFEVGSQYLISAQSGTVNYCGFSGPSTPEYRAAFQQAFAG